MKMADQTFTVSEATFEGGSMRYLSSGEGERYAVILQGWATNHEVYSSIISELSAKYKVIFPLFPGFGNEKDPAEPMTVSDYAKLTDGLLRHLGIESADFFCHSYGGRVFFKLCDDPSRFTKPGRVILCDAAGIKQKRGLLSRLKSRTVSLGGRLLATPVMRFIYPDLLAELRAKSGSEDYRNATDVMRRTLILAVNEDLRGIISKVDAPTLILWGANDTAVPLSDAYFMESEIADSAVVVFGQSGHFPFATEWKAFRAVMSSFFDSPQ